MSPHWISSYWKWFFRGARAFALLLMIVSLAGAVSIAVDRHSQMDRGLKWGLVTLLAALCVLSALMLRAPTRRP